MNEYDVWVQGKAFPLRWVAESAAQAGKEVTETGHQVVHVRLVREGVPQACPGVVCRCGEEGVRFCAAHGRVVG